MVRLLDLYCGAGGAAVGYHRAGFEVVGVDIEAQPRYPFEFVRMDVLDFLGKYAPGRSTGRVRYAPFGKAPFDVVHASPPCQRYTSLRSVFDSSKYEDLIAATRFYLALSGLPYVIENVVGAPLRADLTLCAAAFGLRSYRHRIFEIEGFKVAQPEHPRHVVRVNRRKKNRRAHWDAGGFVTVVGDIGRYVGPEAMGIDWMTGNELSQAIPPAYTEWVGRRLMASLQGVAA